MTCLRTGFTENTEYVRCQRIIIIAAALGYSLRITVAGVIYHVASGLQTRNKQGKRLYTTVRVRAQKLVRLADVRFQSPYEN